VEWGLIQTKLLQPSIPICIYLPTSLVNRAGGVELDPEAALVQGRLRRGRADPSQPSIYLSIYIYISGSGGVGLD